MSIKIQKNWLKLDTKPMKNIIFHFFGIKNDLKIFFK